MSTLAEESGGLYALLAGATVGASCSLGSGARIEACDPPIRLEYGVVARQGWPSGETLDISGRWPEIAVCGSKLWIDGQVELPESEDLTGALRYISWLLRIRSHSSVRIVLRMSRDPEAVIAGEYKSYRTLFSLDRPPPRLLRPQPPEEHAPLSPEHLDWVASHWSASFQALSERVSFSNAMIAAVRAPWADTEAYAQMMVWSGLEALFSPGDRGELTHQLAASLAAFLKPPGDDRLAIYQEVRRLYVERSKAVHGQKMKQGSDALQRSHELLCRALLRCIEERDTPDPNLLRNRLVMGR